MALRLRPARLGDYPHFVRWFPMLESGDAVPSEATWRERLVASTTVAELSGSPAGYCHAQIFGTHGYVRHLVVEPTLRRSGAGRALLEHVAAVMRADGCLKWQLNVKLDNEPAVSLYRALGMTKVYDSTVLSLAWSDCDGLPAPPVTARVLEPNASQRRAMETHFDLPVGRLGSRGAPGALLRMVQGRTVGVIAFDPRSHTAFPFRADSCEAGIALLQGVRPLCDVSRVRLVVEGHAALEALLVGAGARVLDRFIHMRGLL